MPRCVRFNTLQLGQGCGRLKFSAAHVSEDRVDTRLKRRIVAKFSDRHQQRPIPGQGHSHSTIRYNYVALLGS